MLSADGIARSCFSKAEALVEAKSTQAIPEILILAAPTGQNVLYHPATQA